MKKQTEYGYEMDGKQYNICLLYTSFITGENAHSREFSEDAYRLAAEPKELYIVPGAGHVDLYDRVSPVSYTHLDVYKRQGYISGAPRWVLDGNAILFQTERYGMRAHASWGSQQDVMQMCIRDRGRRGEGLLGLPS